MAIYSCAVPKDFPDGFDIVIPCLLEGGRVADAINCAGTGGRIVMYEGGLL
jgi:L-iditol 2-dehydrogenase